MPLYIVQNDITSMRVDAIVNAANESLLGGGGVDGAIHRAAGSQLLAECRTLGGCRTGQAKITGGYRLPAKYVIHTVGPIWRGGGHGERELLVSAYRSSLELALANRCETLAFPLISSGVYGYPKDQALRVAVDTIADFLLSHDMTVWLVIFDRASYTIGRQLFAEIDAYISERYTAGQWTAASCPAPGSLDQAPGHLEESFSRMLLQKMDERGLTDAQCYRKANLDRKLFPKIRSDIHYRPSKPTAMAFAIALSCRWMRRGKCLRKPGLRSPMPVCPMSLWNILLPIRIITSLKSMKLCLPLTKACWGKWICRRSSGRSNAESPYTVYGNGSYSIRGFGCEKRLCGAGSYPGSQRQHIVAHIYGRFCRAPFYGRWHAP